MPVPGLLWHSHHPPLPRSRSRMLKKPGNTKKVEAKAKVEKARV
jgi:hypothetical protein